MSIGKCIVIFGGGPAGLSAGLWLRNLGFEPCVVEPKDRGGGLQNLNFLGNDWVLGQTGQTGPMLAKRFVDHALDAGVRLMTDVRPTQVSQEADGFRVRLDSGMAIDCAAVLVATGTRYRADEVLATAEGIDTVDPVHIAYGPHAFVAIDAQVGRRILIIGGGDNAFENARLLAPRAAAVQLAIRSRPRAQQALAAAVAEQVAAGRCRLLQPAKVRALRETKQGIEATLAVADRMESITVDRIHVLAGYEPNTSFIDKTFAAAIARALRFDEQGYLSVDAHGRTSAPGIYAAGDVCNPEFPCVVSAIADGARVARTIEQDMRAS